jgi:hypothetical protein
LPDWLCMLRGKSPGSPVNAPFIRYVPDCLLRIYRVDFWIRLRKSSVMLPIWEYNRLDNAVR